MSNTLEAVLIDQREPEWLQRLTFGGVATTITMLDTGDVWVACADGALLACERKTSDDLLNTLAQGRLLSQAAELAKASQWAYLMITGMLYPGPENKTITDRGITGWVWSAVQGALLSIQELGVHIVHLASDAEFEHGIMWLASRSHDAQMLIPPVKTSQFLNAGEALLASLPGIGIERAQALLEYCGSPAQALAFLTDMTTSSEHIAGIGDITKQKVRKILVLPSWAELALVSTEGKLIEQGILHVPSSN